MSGCCDFWLDESVDIKLSSELNFKDVELDADTFEIYLQTT